MNKEKLRKLPFNLFWCASSFITPFWLISIFTELNILFVVGISLYVYLLDVSQSCSNDVFQDKIKALEERISKLAEGKK